MIATKSLPLYLKRASRVFLVSMFCILVSSSQKADIPPNDIKNSIRTIIIDAGHGGKDSGAVGKKAKEKDIALKIALKLGKLIEENVKDVKIIYTRKTDVFIPLRERAKIANDSKADLFISVHVNANRKTSP
jgi:N-acetylmuramoyl-L-alanine amidase